MLNFDPHPEAKYRFNYQEVADEINAAAEEDPSRFIDLVREWSRKDLFFLMYFVLRVNLNHPWIIERIKEVEGCNDRTLDLWSREHWKSTIITYGLNIQEILRNPEIRIGIFSHTRALAKAFLHRIKHTFESNEVLKSVFPDIFWQNPQYEAPRWSLDEGIIVRRQGIYQEATIEANGLVDSMPTGKHYDILHYDDVVTRESVTTAEQLAKIDDCFRLSFNLGAVDHITGAKGKIRVIGTPYHYNDQYAKMEKDGGWVVRKHPCIDENGVPVLLDKTALEEKRQQMGPYVFSCLPADSLILMSNFSLKRIADIEEGDTIIGLAKGGQTSRGGMVSTPVVAISKRIDKLYRYHLANGDYIDCTRQHRWWVGRWRDTDHGNTYLPLSENPDTKKHTSAVVKIIDIPWSTFRDEDKEYAAWLGGIFDGEGSVSGGYITISQSRRHHPEVCDRIEYCLNKLGFDFGVHERDGDSGNLMYYIRGGRNEFFRFLLMTNPAKRQQIVDGLMMRGGRVGGKKIASNNDYDGLGRVKVIKSECLGETEVYNIQTVTGNYIADGYASSNCQMLLNPLAKRDQRFREEWLKYYRELPSNLALYLICDPANEKKIRRTGLDYTVYWLWGLDSLGNKFWIDCIRDRLTLTERWKALKRMRKKYPAIQRVGYEQYGMTADIQHYEEMMAIEGFYFNIVELGGTKLSKEDRIVRLVPAFEQGKIYLPETLLYEDKDGNTIDLVQIFVQEEYLRFPFCKHDDLLDAAARIEDKALEVMEPFDDAEGFEDMPMSHDIDRFFNRYGGKEDGFVDVWTGY